MEYLITDKLKILFNSIPNFSYIIPYRKSSNLYREKNLDNIIKYLLNFKNIELIIIEQDDESKFDGKLYKNSNLKHIFTKYNGLFNRGWGLNVGINYSSNDVVFFGDGDVIINPYSIQDCINEIKMGFEVINPINKSKDLSLYQSNLIINNGIINWNINTDGLDRNTNFTSEVVCFNKSSFYKIKYWPEFEGWGGEDNIMTIKCKNFLKWKQLNYNGFHLFHERELNDGPNHPNYKNIINTISEFNRKPKNILLKELESIDISNLGLINKYNNEYFIKDKKNYNKIPFKQKSKMLIPKKLHWIWLGKNDIPQEFLNFRETFTKNFPEYECYVWTDDDDYEWLINKKYFDVAPNMAGKADILRYEILNKYGGIYIDTDFECYKNFEYLINEVEGFSASEDNKHISIGIMGFIPNHPLLLEIIKKIPESIDKNKHLDVNHCTGPLFLTDFYYNKYNGSKIKIFDRDYFYPYGYWEKYRRNENFSINPNCVAVHHWAHSWA